MDKRILFVIAVSVCTINTEASSSRSETARRDIIAQADKARVAADAAPAAADPDAALAHAKALMNAAMASAIIDPNVDRARQNAQTSIAAAETAIAAARFAMAAAAQRAAVARDNAGTKVSTGIGALFRGRKVRNDVLPAAREAARVEAERLATEEAARVAAEREAAGSTISTRIGALARGRKVRNDILPAARAAADAEEIQQAAAISIQSVVRGRAARKTAAQAKEAANAATLSSRSTISIDTIMEYATQAEGLAEAVESTREGVTHNDNIDVRRGMVGGMAQYMAQIEELRSRAVAARRTFRGSDLDAVDQAIGRIEAASNRAKAAYRGAAEAASGMLSSAGFFQVVSPVFEFFQNGLFLAALNFSTASKQLEGRICETQS